MATTLSATHQRYLLTGTRVALEALPNNVKPDNSADDMQAVPAETSLPMSHMSGGHGGQASGHFGGHFDGRRSESRVEGKVEGRMEGRGLMPQQFPGYARASTSGGEGRGPSTHSPGVVQGRANGVGGSGMGRKSSYSDILSDAVPGWRVDELLNIPELADGYTLADIGSSKVSMHLTSNASHRAFVPTCICVRCVWGMISNDSWQCAQLYDECDPRHAHVRCHTVRGAGGGRGDCIGRL